MHALRSCKTWFPVIALTFVIGCCTPNQTGLVAPLVNTIAPASNTSSACPTAVVTATFSEAMTPGTFSSSTFTLSTSGAAVAGQVSYGGSTATFSPTNKLLAGTSYVATVTTGVKDLYGNPLAANVVSNFTVAANGCNPPPTVTLISPAGGTTGACPNAAVVATFSEPMNIATVTAATFTLSPGVIGTVTHDATNTIFTLTPSNVLASNTQYTAQISTVAQDLFGNPLANPVVSSFTTAANGCHPPPTVTGMTPTAGATGVCPNKVISITFNEAITPSTLTAQSFQVAGPSGAVAGLVTYDPVAHTATFIPTAALALNSLYTVTITTAVQDTYGNTLGNNYVWSFTTGANSCLPAAPPVTVSPASSAANVCTSTVVSATFAQAMNVATLNSTSFTLTSAGGTQVAGAITHDAAGKMFTLTPTAALAVSTTYTATITTAAQDTFGNPLASNFTWTFTTAATPCSATGPPTVISVSPLAGAIGVCSNTVLNATFNEAMNPATINTTTITLSPTAPGAVTLDATGKIAAYTPTANLALNTTYTATISTGAQDTLGNPLAAPFVWSFTTSKLACQQPVPLGTAANFEILAGSTVTSTGPTVITGGNLGLSPGTSVTGFPPGTLVAPAVMHVTDQVAAQAQLDLTIAYNYAAGLAGGATLPADMTGQTFTPGLYNNATAVTLSGGTVTLDAQGNANSIFIFQVGTTLITLGNTQVVLKGGAQAKNVYWQVGSAATLGVNSIFEGTILASQSITLDTGATLQGRALAQNAAVTLDSNSVVAP
jgi:hypothetical protein